MQTKGFPKDAKPYATAKPGVKGGAVIATPCQATAYCRPFGLSKSPDAKGRPRPNGPVKQGGRLSTSEFASPR